jgi:RNA-directed DNA polymerase
MQWNHPEIPFERYADDAVCHCRSEDQAQRLRQELEQRLAECRLELHPQKTQIVYCKDDDRRELRRWHLHTRSDKSLEDLSRIFNPVLRGWVNYYSRFYKSPLYPTFQHMDRILVRWALRKDKRLRGHQRRAAQWLRRIARRQPELFAHWRLWQAAAGR